MDNKAENTVKSILVLYGNNTEHGGQGRVGGVVHSVYRGYNPGFPESTLVREVLKQIPGVRATAVEECSYKQHNPFLKKASQMFFLRC